MLLKILAVIIFMLVIAIGLFASAMFCVIFANGKRISREEEQEQMDKESKQEWDKWGEARK